MVGDLVSALDDLAPGAELALDDFEFGVRVEHVESEGGSGELAFVFAVAAELEDWGFAVGDDVGATETG